MNQYIKESIWLLVPFLYGYLANTFLIITPLLSQIVFGVFWFWVGMRYAKLEGSNVKNFLIGNSIWLLSFLLFLWQFAILGDESRNLFLAGISQYYMFSFVWLGKQLTLLFTNILDVTKITIISYLIMFVVFSTGYATKKLRSRKG